VQGKLGEDKEQTKICVEVDWIVAGAATEMLLLLLQKMMRKPNPIIFAAIMLGSMFRETE